MRKSCLLIVLAWMALLLPAIGSMHAAHARTLMETINAGELDKLFAKLKAANDPAEAQLLSTRIWQLWFQTENSAARHLMGQAQVARRTGQLEQALVALDQLVELAPGYAEAWNQRATIHFMLGRDAQSIRDIQQVLKLEPRHFGALSGLGLIHMRAENWRSAIASFERALALHPFLGERTLIPKLKKKLEGTRL